MKSIVIGIVGAESTGKTVLATELAAALGTPAALPTVHSVSTPKPELRGRSSVALVPEYLREFCMVHARTPRQTEQDGIAREQNRRIEASAADHDIVIADTTPLMIAVYSDIVFNDRSLYDWAEHAHRRCDLTLLTALDVAWQEDGLQRDGPHVREPVDRLVRASLDRAGADYAVVAGIGPARLDAALRAVRRTIDLLEGREAAESVGRGEAGSRARSPRWTPVCDTCGDPDCERLVLAGGAARP